jgi:hypothetical protein
MSRLLALVALALGLGALPARAGERWALVIGANHGEPDETPLVYAERDAERMGQVFTRLGAVPPENLVTLLGPDAPLVRRAFETLGARIRLSPEPPILFVYYSGHADSQGLHLRGTSLPFKELKRLAQTLAAELSVFIVDACRSGGLIRAKGARPAAPFEIEVKDELRAAGVAILTSSSASEDAQESDRLEGGVFTHHLLTGLAGAADESKDARVTLSEAYRYAYAQTLASTSTSPVVQHPSFAYALEGSTELVLTRIDKAAGLARLHLPEPGQYLIFERFGGHELVAELEARPDTELLLRPGPYLLRRRETAVVYERELTLLANARTSAPTSTLTLVPYRHAVRKGYGQARRLALSLGADLEATGPLLSDTSLGLGGALSLQVDFAAAALRARARYLHATGIGEIALDQHTLGLDVAVYRLFDLGPHGLGFGLRGGLDWVAQRFETAGLAPSRDQFVGRFAPLLRAELALGGRVALNLDAGAEVALLERLSGGETSFEARVTPVFSVGFGVLLP